jgi:putative peptidoglycan lipid II flippase
VAFPRVTTATRLVYIIFPAVLFVALAGILTAVLNGFHKFGLAAFAPALSSLTVIGAALVAGGDKAIYTVGYATAFGFILQFIFLLPATAILGIRYRFVVDLRHPAVLKLLRLGIPLFLYLVIANASSFLERHLASQLSAGAVSTLTYAMRLFAIPANFFAAPLAIVAYPLFAREAGREKRGELSNQVSRIFRLLCLLFLPLTIWVVLNALPLTRFFYERGQFQLQDSVVTSKVLMLYGIGILPNAITVVLLRCFYAAQDTITPLLAESVDLAFYIVAATVLTKHFGISGLALTRGMTFFLVAIILIVVLRNRHGLLTIDLNFIQFIVRILVASLCMAVVSWGTLHFLQSAFDSGKAPLRLAVMGTVLCSSGMAFLGVAHLLGLEEAAHIFNTALRLLPGNRDGQWFLT